LRFTGQTKGCLVHRFTGKLLTQNHVKATQYGHKTYLFKLTSRRIYELIGKPNLRDHRAHTADFIRIRLLILDFVLTHPEHRYLETEAEKLRFFREQTAAQPGVLWQPSGPEGLDLPLKRYCKERFPVFVSPDNTSCPTGAAPTFVYLDPANHGRYWFTSYLDRHRNFLRRLPKFSLVYASPSHWNLDRASQIFVSVLRTEDRPDPQHLTRYFQIRRHWETGKHSCLTRADRDLLRDGDKRYRIEPFESAYQSNWDARKSTSWPGATPFCSPIPGQNALRRSRSLPAMIVIPASSVQYASLTANHINLLLNGLSPLPGSCACPTLPHQDHRTSSFTHEVNAHRDIPS
jgi:hypothetical protein